MTAALLALLACPVCWGDPNSELVSGAKAGVLFLLAVIVGLLMAIALVARSWARKGRALAEARGVAGRPVHAARAGAETAASAPAAIA